MQTSPTDGQGLKLRPEEMEALAIRWPRLPPEVQQDWLAKMNRAQRKRFERTVANQHEDQQLWATKLMTRQDTANMLGMFIQQNILPFAARLDAVEAWIRHRERPWHYRLRVRIVTAVAGVQQWLESKGIKLVKLQEAEPAMQNPESSESGEAVAGGSVSGDATAAHTEDAEGSRPAASLIEVVRR